MINHDFHVLRTREYLNSLRNDAETARTLPRPASLRRRIAQTALRLAVAVEPEILPVAVPARR